MTTPSSDVTFSQSGTGAVSRTAESRFRDTVSVKDFGAAGSGSVDDQPAIQAAIDYVCSAGGGILFFPPGTYRCDSQLSWSSAPVTLQGSGSSVQPGVGTILKFPQGLDGAVRIKNGTAGLGAFSQVRNLIIRGSGTTAVSEADAATGKGAGLVLQASGIRVENCTVQQFEGNGCMVLSAPSTADGTINANNCLIMGLCCWDNLANGFAAQGVDSNACTIVKLDCSNNGGFGVYENSFLGNVYVGAHFAGNVSPPIRIGGGSGYNRFYGCYKEGGGQKVVQLDYPGTGKNEIDFNLADGDGILGHPLLVDDFTLSKDDEIKLQNVRRRAAFGGDGANGTFVISPKSLLVRQSKSIQLQNGDETTCPPTAPTANWFVSVNPSGGLHFANGHYDITLPLSRPVVSGSRGGNAALASLLSTLDAIGLVSDTTTT